MKTRSKRYPLILDVNGNPILFLSDAEFVIALIERAAARHMANCKVLVTSLTVEDEERPFLQIDLAWKRLSDVAGPFLQWFECSFKSWNYITASQASGELEVFDEYGESADIEYWDRDGGLTYTVQHIEGAEWE